MEEEEAEKDMIEGEIQFMLKRFDEINRQIEVDNDRAHGMLKSEGKSEVYNVRSECSKYKGQLSIETKKVKHIQDDLERMTEEEKVYTEQIDVNL